MPGSSRCLQDLDRHPPSAGGRRAVEVSASRCAIYSGLVSGFVADVEQRASDRPLPDPNRTPIQRLTWGLDNGGVSMNPASEERTMNRITTATAGLAVAAVSFAGLSGTAFADSASTPTTSTTSPTASPSTPPAHGNTLAAIKAKAAAAITPPALGHLGRRQRHQQQHGDLGRRQDHACSPP